MLTGIKDLDYKILNELGDRDLVNVCQVNKTAKEICDDQVFWLNRILSKFPKVPIEILVRSKGERSWSEYYIKDLRLLNKMTPNKALIEGVVENRTDYTTIALNEGADVHEDNELALRFASQLGHAEVVKILLKAGADVHAVDETPLYLAIEAGYTDVAKILLEAGADPHIDHDAPLEYAIKHNHTEVVKLLRSYM